MRKPPHFRFATNGEGLSLTRNGIPILTVYLPDPFTSVPSDEDGVVRCRVEETIKRLASLLSWIDDSTRDDYYVFVGVGDEELSKQLELGTCRSILDYANRVSLDTYEVATGLLEDVEDLRRSYCDPIAEKKIVAIWRDQGTRRIFASTDPGSLDQGLSFLQREGLFTGRS